MVAVISEKLEIEQKETVDAKERQFNVIKDVLPDWGKPWYKVPHLLKLNLSLVVLFISGVYNGYDNSVLNGLQSVPEWRDYFFPGEVQPNPTRLGTLANGILYGSIAALPFTSYICDKLGRIGTIIFGAIITLIGVVVQSVSQNFAMLLVGRMILGFGVLFPNTASPMLCAEISYPPHRPYITALSQCFYGLRGIIASWTTYGTNEWTSNSPWKWRTPLLVQLIFPIIQLTFLYWVPESPRYWVSRGKTDKARKILLDSHAGGNEQVGGQLVDFELLEITYVLENDRSLHSVSWLEFVKTKANRHRLFIILFIPVMTQLSGNGPLSYFLNIVLDTAGIKSAKQQLGFNGGFAVYNFLLGLISVSLVEYVGRRRLFLLSTFFTMIIYTIFTIVSARNSMDGLTNKSLSNAVIAMIFLFWTSFIMANLTTPTVYQTEILPYHLRAKVYVIGWFMLDGVLLFNGFVTPIAMDAIGWKYYILYCCILAVELVVVYYSFPETKGLSLEEVSSVFGESVVPFESLQDIVGS